MADPLDSLRAEFQSASFKIIPDLWRFVEDTYGAAGRAWLGRNDRFYLLVMLLHRQDALHPWLYERCREVEASPDGHLDLWAREHYKGEALDTLVATPSGWTKFGDLTVGDALFGADGQPCTVIAQTPVFHDPHCYEVEFDDGACAQVSSAHHWTVERGNEAGGFDRVTLATSEIFQHDHRPGNRLAMQINEPLALGEANLPVEPYKLGAQLGSGHSAAPIPAIYLRASIKQRLALLRGLLDTHGDCDADGQASFCHVQKRRVGEVYELAATLGLQPHMAHCPQSGGFGDWRVSFQTCRQTSPRRYIVAVRAIPTVPMRCIQVDRADGLYLTGRAMLVTHNSTIITFSGIIQELLVNPEITIGIFSHTKPVARKFMLQIKQELEKNTELQQVYPDVLYADPKNESSKWSEEKGIVVRRKSNPKEASVEAHGLVDGQPTGAHFMLRVYDDVVTRESVSTPDQVKKTTSAWELSDNLGAANADGIARAWMPGTRYSFSDTYQTIIDRGALKVRVYPATDNGLPDGKPVFLSEAAWADKKLKQGPATIACQMLQNPAAGNEAMFRKEWLSFIDIRPSTLNVYILVDPAHSKKKGSDNTAMAVIGIDAGGNKYLLDGYRHKMGLRQRWEALRGLRRHWLSQPGVQMVRCGYERYGMQADLEYFEEQMQLDRDAFDIQELGWTSDGAQSKDDRVQRLQPDFMAHKFFLSAYTPTETANQKRIREQGQSFRIFKPVSKRDHEGNVYKLNAGFLEEYLTYPFSAKKDLIDAASRVYDMQPTPPIVIDEYMTDPDIFDDGI